MAPGVHYGHLTLTVSGRGCDHFAWVCQGKDIDFAPELAGVKDSSSGPETFYCALQYGNVNEPIVWKHTAETRWFQFNDTRKGAGDGVVMFHPGQMRQVCWPPLTVHLSEATV